MGNLFTGSDSAAENPSNAVSRGSSSLMTSLASPAPATPVAGLMVVPQAQAVPVLPADASLSDIIDAGPAFAAEVIREKLSGSRNESASSNGAFLQNLSDPSKLVHVLRSKFKEVSVRRLSSSDSPGPAAAARDDAPTGAADGPVCFGTAGPGGRGVVLPIKMILTELNGRSAPVISSLLQLGKLVNIVPEDTGYFHTALLIGPFIFDWNNGHLCIPRDADSGSAFVAADIEIDTIDDVDDVWVCLSEIICKWNTTMLYKSITTSEAQRQRFGNCQQFANDVLSAFETRHFTKKLKEDSPFARFVANLRYTGDASLVYHVGQELQEQFELEARYVFRSHSRLDAFVRSLNDRDPRFRVNFLEDYKLLKAFDRACWLKFNRFAPGTASDDPTLKECAPLSRVELSGEISILCPFGSPQATGSIESRGDSLSDYKKMLQDRQDERSRS